MSWYSHGARFLDQLTPLLFLEETVQDRKVLLCGAPDSSLATYLLELGAGSVTSLPVDDSIHENLLSPILAASRAREGGLPFEDAAFELVLDFELPCLDDAFRDQRIAEIERVLSRDGYAVTILPAGQDLGLAGLIPSGTQPPSLGYGALTTLLRERFPCVEVYFQSLVVGYFFGPVEVTGAQQGVVPHTGLMGDDVDPASAWLFAFGPQVPTLSQLTLVQLPTVGLADAARVAHLAGTSSMEGTLEAGVSDARQRSGASLAALAEASPEAQAELDDLLDGLEARTRERDELAEEIVELERRIARDVEAMASTDHSDVADRTERDEPAKLDAMPAGHSEPHTSTVQRHDNRHDDGLHTARLRAPSQHELRSHALNPQRDPTHESVEAERGVEVDRVGDNGGATQRLIEELAVLRDAFAARGVELEKLAAGVNRLMGERDSLRNRLLSLAPPGSKGVSSLGTAPLQEMDVQARGVTTALQGRIAHLTQELERATDELQQRETQLHNDRADRDALRVRLRAAQSQLEQRSVELGRARDTLVEVTGQRDLLERLVGTHERDVERLKEELAAAHAEVLHEKQSAEVSARQAGALIDDEARFVAIAQLQARADWQNAVLAEAQDEGTQLRTRLELTSALLEEARGQLERERARGDLFQAQLNEARSAAASSPSLVLSAGTEVRPRPSTSGQGADPRHAEPQAEEGSNDGGHDARKNTLTEENAALRAQLEEREHRIRRLYQRLSVTSV